MKYQEGNLIELAKNGKFDVIVHGCNCFCTMGAGIAKSLRDEWPDVYKADLLTVKGEISKLGTISTALIKLPSGINFAVINAYTQFTFWEKNPIHYESLFKCFQKIKEFFSGSRIAYPLIGCGLAGGNWNVVEPLIDQALEGEDHTLVYLNEQELLNARKI